MLIFFVNCGHRQFKKLLCKKYLKNKNKKYTSRLNLSTYKKF